MVKAPSMDSSLAIPVGRAPALPKVMVPPKGAMAFALLVVMLGAFQSVLALEFSPTADFWATWMWGLAAFGGQLLTFPTVTGQGRITLATPIHLAMAVVLAPADFLPAIWLSRLGVELVHRNQAWYRILFNTAQVSLSVLGAHTVYRLLITDSAAPPSLQGAPVYGLVVLAYYVINIGTVCCVITLASGESFFRTWRKNYGYRVEILSTVGLALLGPLLVLGYRAHDGLGLLLFLMPMIFIWKASLEVTALKRAQSALVASERMAERGELGVEIGSEINQYLTQIYGQVQLILRNRYEREEIDRRLGIVLSQLGNITSFSKNLIDSSRRKTVMVPTNLSSLVASTVSCLKLQSRLEDTSVTLDLDEDVDEAFVDTLQIQQAIRSLVMNAAEAGTKVAVRVGRQDSGKIEITVGDNGPGVPEPLRARIFDPGFTTKANARGMGLCTTYRIVASHHGQLLVENAPGGGACFRIVLPTRQPGPD